MTVAELMEYVEQNNVCLTIDGQLKGNTRMLYVRVDSEKYADSRLLYDDIRAADEHIKDFINGVKEQS